MGIYDRDYIRDSGRKGSDDNPINPRNWSPVGWLIALNVAVHLGMVLLLDEERVGYLTRGDMFAGHVYLLLTHQFVHLDLMHLAMNMLGLYFAGRMLVELIGPRQFLGVYLGAGALGGLTQALYAVHPIMGASGAVFGVLFAVISLRPWQEMNLLLFFVIPVRARLWVFGFWAVVLEIAFFSWQEFFGGKVFGHHVANLAHLGGAFFGWFWIAYLFPIIHRREEYKARQRRWSERFGAGRVVEAEVSEPRLPEPPQPYVSTEIDAILDKISAQGIHSLTEEEKRLLQQSSERLARRVEGK